MLSSAPIGVFGGTFDPIHNAHLRLALDALETLPLAEVRFIPSAQPPHRGEPSATPARRLQMLEQAIAGQPGFVLDDRELRRDGPSYMVDTLSSLRRELGTTPLCLLLGLDAFYGLPDWHRWTELPELAHLVVLSRPGYRRQDLPPALTALTAERGLDGSADLGQRPAGGVWFQPSTELAISATAIRQLLAAGRSPRYLLPEPVYQIIREHRLYRR